MSRRYAPEESYEEARAEIEAVIRSGADSVPGLGLDIQLVGHLIPTSDPYGPHWPRWQEALVSALGTGRATFANGVPQAVRISGTCSKSPACRR